MPRKHRFESRALRFLFGRYIGDDPKQRATYEEELADAEVARTLWELRTKAGLTQRELAERVGTTASAISRLEDARYGGHSLAMLRRIAAAFDLRLEVRFVLRKKPRVRASTGTRRAAVPVKRATVLRSRAGTST